MPEDDPPECYHHECSDSATRLHIDSVGLKQRSTPCCDEHEPMAATDEIVYIGSEPEITEQTTLADGGRLSTEAGSGGDS